MRTTVLEWFRSTWQADSQDISANVGQTLSSPVTTANERLGRRTFPVDFFHHETVTHCMCIVERRHETRLLLRISSEMGTISLSGLIGEERGQIEIDNMLIPFRVVRARLPFVDVLIFSQQARPVRRQFLRIPANFSLRFRRQGAQGMWISGQGIDLSAGGCSFLLAPPSVPITHARYDVDMLLTLPQSGEVRPLFNGEVRWVRAASRHIATGVEIHNPGQRKILAMAVTEIQQALTRRHEGSMV